MYPSSLSSYTVDIDLGSPLTYAFSFSRFGTLNNFLFYYMAGNGQIRSISVARNKGTPLTLTSTEDSINGYAPVEIIDYDNTKSQMMGLTSMSNIDNSLYALVQTCN